MSRRRTLLILPALLLTLRAPALGADAFHALDLIRPSRSTTPADFTVPGITGRPLRLSDFKGRVVFLNFWATWCPPCKEEMPSIERLYRRYKAKGLTILAISIDRGRPGRVAGFANSLGLTFPIGLDPELSVANQYALRSLPATFLIDRKGTIAALALGARDWDSKNAHAVIESLLK